MRIQDPFILSDVEVNGTPGQEVLILDGEIAEMGQTVTIEDVEVVDGRGGAVIPALNDHHIHLASYAVSRNSINCSPHRIKNEDALEMALRHHDHAAEWIRGINYHPSTAGEIDAAWLDTHAPAIPVRIQHQGGRLWVFNSIALERLQVTDSDPFERIDGRLTGRLYDADQWLRERMAKLGEASLPDLSAASHELASHGVIGLTDTTPSNNPDTFAWFKKAQQSELLQDVLMMGDASLNGVTGTSNVAVGAHKFHLLESNLPDLDEVVQAILKCHDTGRNVAFHCVTRVELGYALAALRQAKVMRGDRIEHASVTPPEWMDEISKLELIVVTQPALIQERGDHYLDDVDPEDIPWLYRLRGFMDAGIPLAGSSDAPYTSPNPWKAMHAAVARATRGGAVIGENEALSPEEALGLYLSPLDQPGTGQMQIKVGDAANLCVLNSAWSVARENLAAVNVRLTIKNGEIIAGGFS